jgi:hypothetical protein
MHQFSIALAMFLSTVVAPAPTTAPGACLVTRGFEDGSKTAICLDGPDVVRDPDGQLYLNRAGMPLRTPGWYAWEVS